MKKLFFLLFIFSLSIFSQAQKDSTVKNMKAAELEKYSAAFINENYSRLLFTGNNRTAKTKAVESLARRSGRQVYTIDLSTVVSKYSGETEKNLDKVFARAENKNWILFFDEADALFGKRGDVKDAHDKYANQEVAYLLQKIENYPGLVVLATNSNKADSLVRKKFRLQVEF